MTSLVSGFGTAEARDHPLRFLSRKNNATSRLRFEKLEFVLDFYN